MARGFLLASVLASIAVAYTLMRLLRVPEMPSLPQNPWWGRGKPQPEDTSVRHFTINVPDEVSCLLVEFRAFLSMVTVVYDAWYSKFYPWSFVSRLTLFLKYLDSFVRCFPWNRSRYFFTAKFVSYLGYRGPTHTPGTAPATHGTVGGCQLHLWHKQWHAKTNHWLLETGISLEGEGSQTKQISTLQVSVFKGILRTYLFLRLHFLAYCDREMFLWETMVPSQQANL